MSQAAQAAKEEGNRLFGMGKYSAAIEVRELSQHRSFSSLFLLSPWRPHA